MSEQPALLRPLLVPIIEAVQRTLRERGQHPLEPSRAFPEPSQHSRGERNAARERNALDALAASPPTPQTRLGPFLPLHRPPPGQPLFDALAKPATVQQILKEPYFDADMVTDELVDVLINY